MLKDIVHNPSLANHTIDIDIEFDNQKFLKLVSRDFSHVPAEDWSRLHILFAGNEVGKGNYGSAYYVNKLRESKKLRISYFIARNIIRALSLGKYERPSSKWILEKSEGKDVLVALNLGYLDNPRKLDDFYGPGKKFTPGELLAHEIQHAAVHLLKLTAENPGIYSGSEEAAMAYSIATHEDWEHVVTIT